MINFVNYFSLVKKAKSRSFMSLSLVEIDRIIADAEVKVMCESAANIAFVKYWGKANDELIIPMNDNFGVTLENVKSTTTICASRDLEDHCIVLNDEVTELSERVRGLIDLALENADFDRSKFFDSREQFDEHKICISSFNEFPTAAGLASSASGLSSIAFGISNILGIENKEIQSVISRVGSGSACRSIHGGWVKWETGNNIDDVYSSYSTQLYDEHHWDDLRVMILVVDDSKKEYSSSNGMTYSRETSAKLRDRVDDFLPNLIPQVEKAVQERNLSDFLSLMMLDCENFHAVCLDTTPSLDYRNETSMFVCDIVNCYNDVKGSVCAGYTFDAGANAILFVEEENAEELLSIVRHFFPESDREINEEDLGEVIKACEEILGKTVKDGLKQIIQTRVGSGPKLL